ncbi:Uncharacterised protein [Helicobacter cholecystus]|nr:Uncharacterised protein [Helicobacter cholecystus]
MVRLFYLSLLCMSSIWAHGIFYDLKEDKALVFHINFSQTTPASYAKVIIYKGDSAIPYLEANCDERGVFAFIPPKEGTYRAYVSGTSDHGEHTQEFSFEVGKDFSLSTYQQPLYERYSGVLSAIGLLFGLFGILALLKSRKKN